MQKHSSPQYPFPPFRLGGPQITPEMVEAKKFGADKDYCWLHSAEDDRESDSGSDLSTVTDKHWTAMISSHGSDEAEFCQQ